MSERGGGQTKLESVRSVVGLQGGASSFPLEETRRVWGGQGALEQVLEADVSMEEVLQMEGM